MHKQSISKQNLIKHSIRLSGITPESLVDGPGLRYVIFAQGCRHGCPKCHNPTSWDINGGKEFTVKEIIRMIKKQCKARSTVKQGVTQDITQSAAKTQGLTLSGGEPFLQAGEFAQAANAARQIGLDIVTYTGYTYEELTELEKDDSGIAALLRETDLLIDGRYIDEKRTSSLPFRGSSNQRIIDMPKTREKGKITLWKNSKKKEQI